MSKLRHIGQVLALAISLAPMAATAESDPSLMAKRAANQLGAASIALQEAKSARNRVKALTQTIRAYEDGLEALRDGVRGAAIRERAIDLKWQAESADLQQLLGVLQSMQGLSAPVLVLHPDGPVGTARAGMMLADVTPSLHNRAEDLRLELEEITLLRALQESAVDTLTEGLRGVQAARTELSLAISDRSDLPRRFTEDPAKILALVDGAETLSGFASGLAYIDGSDTAPELADFSTAQGQIPLPVQSTILRKFQEADAAGIRRPGMVLATRANAIVSAPWPATIRYLGPLLDYGNVMILEPEDDHLLVLAGLDKVFGAAGQVVPAGTPIGLMGGKHPDAQEFLANSGIDAGTERSETLYMELRIGQVPVDPAIWFAVNKD